MGKRGESMRLTDKEKYDWFVVGLGIYFFFTIGIIGWAIADFMKRTFGW